MVARLFLVALVGSMTFSVQARANDLLLAKLLSVCSEGIETRKKTACVIAAEAVSRKLTNAGWDENDRMIKVTKTCIREAVQYTFVDGGTPPIPALSQICTDGAMLGANADIYGHEDMLKIIKNNAAPSPETIDLGPLTLE